MGGNRGLVILLILCCQSYIQTFASKTTPQDWERYLLEKKTYTSYNQLHASLKEELQTTEKFNCADIAIGALLLATYNEKDFKLPKKESAKLIQEADEWSRFCKYKGLRLWALVEIGFYYYSYNDYLLALPYFLSAQKISEELSVNEGVLMSEQFKKIGYFFSTVENYDRSNASLLKALSLEDSSKANYPNLLNAIGRNYYFQKEYDTSLKYYERGKRISVQINDIERYAKLIGDMASAYVELNNFEEAKELFTRDIRISDSIGSLRNGMYARIQYARLLQKLQDFDSSKILLEHALSYAQSQDNLAGFQLEAIDLLLKVSLEEKNLEQELIYRRNIDSLDKLVSRKEGKEALSLINFKIKEDIAKWEIGQAKLKAQNQADQKSLVVIVGALIILILGLIFWFYRKKVTKERELVDVKLTSFKEAKDISESKLQEAHSNLASYTTYLLEKNAQIELLEGEIAKISESKTSDTKKQETGYQELLKSHLMTDENWDKFKQAYVREKPEYYQFLVENFSDLTESNLRIVLLQNLELSNQEIAHLLGVTVDAVKKAKQRMRKKYGEKYLELVSGAAQNED